MRFLPAIVRITTLSFAASLAAQVPDGACVVSSITPGFGGPPGPGGLFLVDPHVSGSATIVTGLSPELTNPPGFAGGGACCVRVRPDDGVVLVGEGGGAGTSIELHEIELTGSAVTATNTRSVGTVEAGAFFGGITDIKIIPGSGGDALFSAASIVPAPPLSSPTIAIAQRFGAIQPVAVTGIPGLVFSLATDAAGTTGYASVMQQFTLTASIYSFPLPGGGPAALVATVPQGIGSLDLGNDGNLIATTLMTAEILSIDPANGAITSTTLSGMPLSFGHVERATGRVMYARDGASGPETGWIDASGTEVFLSGGMSGIISGFDLLDNPRVYGSSSPGTDDYRWQAHSQPGGTPRTGNAAFALQMTTTGASAAGCLIASIGDGNATLFGVDVLLDTSSLIPFGDIAGSGSVPIPIPASSTVGLSLCFQTFHLDSGAPQGVAASNGMRVTLMQ